MDDSPSALNNARNPNQGKFTKVLFVCSAGMLRSATAAWVCGQPPYNFNTRSAGVREYAMIPVTNVLIRWADVIVCMGSDRDHAEPLTKFSEFDAENQPLICLGIPDHFEYRADELVELIHARMKEKWHEEKR